MRTKTAPAISLVLLRSVHNTLTLDTPDSFWILFEAIISIVDASRCDKFNPERSREHSE